MAKIWPVMEEETRGPVIGEPEVAAFEAQLRAVLPEGYRRFLLEVNGGELDCRNRLCEGSTMRDLKGLHHPNPTYNLEERVSRARWVLPHSDLLQIGSAESGMVLLAIRGEHRGEVWCLDTVDSRPEGSNPRVLWHDQRDMEKLANSFEELVAKLQPVE